MAWYEKMDVFKSFQTYFTTYETNKYVSRYVCIKLEKMGKQNCKVSHINMTTSDPTLVHVYVFGALNGCGDPNQTIWMN